MVATAEPRPIEVKFKTDVQYHEFECCECGKTDRNTYCEPHRTDMLERLLCWSCNYQRDLEAEIERKHDRMTIIDGHVYGPGNRTSGSFRGMAGRRFDIEYIEPSRFAGKRITTFDLWSGSPLSDRLRERFRDTARFLGDAHKAQVGETTCWNPLTSKSEPYPLPSSLPGLA